MELSVVIFSDVICPWCYIGKRRLEKAIESLSGKHTVRVDWLPFQLNPDMPKEGVPRQEYRIQKFGSLERSQQLDAAVIAAGETEGIDFAFDKIERTPNTLDAHRLIWLASQTGVQDAVVEALFQSYFVEGKDLSKTDVLIDIVAAAGLNRYEAIELLKGDRGLAHIPASAKMSQELQITGVPFFLINRELALSGAQPSDTFIAAFQHVIASH